MKNNYATKFAIVNLDNTAYYNGIKTDYCGRKSICFTKDEKGKRYMQYVRALGECEKINKLNGSKICKVIETYL